MLTKQYECNESKVKKERRTYHSFYISYLALDLKWPDFVEDEVECIMVSCTSITVVRKMFTPNKIKVTVC
jgi:hypothetical protein